MPRRSDDFPMKVKLALAERVGLRCSRPGCTQVTSGPHSGGTKAVKVGIAAHITAASPGGPRFDPSLSAAERRAIDNGIWLCSGCASLVDKDPNPFSAETLRSWRVAAEYRRNQELLGKGDEHEKQRQYRSQFAAVPVTTNTGTLHLAWKGPLQDLDTLEPPHTVTPEELAAIYCTLCARESEPVQPTWAPIRSLEAHDVWLVDLEAKAKRRLKSPHMLGTDAFLRVFPRREPCKRFCGRCGKISDGKLCPECGQAVGAAVDLRGCQ